MRRARTLFRQPWSRQRMALEALVRLLRAWALVRLNPFPRYAASLGEARTGEAPVPADPAKAAVLKDVKWAIGAVNRSFGGRFTCLMQGIACKGMLNRRGIANALVLGARIEARVLPTDPAMAAHAWVCAGGGILVGGEERPGFIAVTSYLSPPGVEAP